MPISVALPAPSIEYYSDFNFPVLFLAQQVLTAIAQNNTFAKSRSAVVEGNASVAPLLAQGGAGVTELTAVRGGRVCSQVTTAAVAAGSAYGPDTWTPAFNPAVYNPGAFLDPSSVVGVIDFHVAMGQTAFAGVADVSGFWFIPNFATGGFPTKTRGGGASSGGFGVGIVNDGGGNIQWDFISYDAVGDLLRVPIGVAVIPDVRNWSTFRFTIISAGPGRAATLTLAVNGASIAGVQGLPFDDITLMRPNTLVATAGGFNFGRSTSGLAGGTMNYQIYARFGRFTTAGQEIQGV